MDDEFLALCDNEMVYLSGSYSLTSDGLCLFDVASTCALSGIHVVLAFRDGVIGQRGGLSL